MLKVAFDIGGVISRYPTEMKALMGALVFSGSAEVHILTDMNPKDARAACEANDLMKYVLAHRIHSADWSAHGDLCKTKVMEMHGIDILIDDRPDYVATGKFIGLVLAPRPGMPYYHENWRNHATAAVMVPPEELEEFKEWKRNRLQ